MGGSFEKQLVLVQKIDQRLSIFKLERNNQYFYELSKIVQSKEKGEEAIVLIKSKSQVINNKQFMSKILGYKLIQNQQIYQILIYCQGSKHTIYTKILQMQKSNQYFPQQFFWSVTFIASQLIQNSLLSVQLSTKTILYSPLKIIDNSIFKHKYFDNTKKHYQLLHLLLELALCQPIQNINKNIFNQCLYKISQRYSSSVLVFLSQLAEGKMPSFTYLQLKKTSPLKIHDKAKYYLTTSNHKTIKAFENHVCHKKCKWKKQNTIPNGYKQYCKENKSVSCKGKNRDGQRWASPLKQIPQQQEQGQNIVEKIIN